MAWSITTEAAICCQGESGSIELRVGLHHRKYPWQGEKASREKQTYADITSAKEADNCETRQVGFQESPCTWVQFDRSRLCVEAEQTESIAHWGARTSHTTLYSSLRCGILYCTRLPALPAAGLTLLAATPQTLSKLWSISCSAHQAVQSTS